MTPSYVFGSRTLRDLASALASGELDLHAYFDGFCERIETVEPYVEALLPENGRRERLHRQADQLLATYPDPANRPSLFGIPVGVKDIFRVDGFPTRCGSTLPPETFAGQESPLVSRLKGQGALILGKTVTTEFAYFEPGPTRNPHDIARTPGGSSSGSAAAVAAGYCPLALGSQTIGSIVRPAAFCGVAGFKPTYGLLPLDGVIPYAPSLDHAGFFVPTAADLPLALQVANGLPQAAVPAWAAAIPEGPYLEHASAEALEAFRSQVETLRAAGFRVDSVPALSDIAEIVRRHNLVAAAEMAAVHRDWFARFESLYRPRTAAWIREGQGIPPEAVEEAREGRPRLREELHALMDGAGVQVWLSPAACGPAPQGIASTGDPAMNFTWTHAGLPTAVVPAGRAENGMPLGLQITARWGEDASLASFATVIGGVLNEVAPASKMNLNTLQERPPVA